MRQSGWRLAIKRAVDLWVAIVLLPPTAAVVGVVGVLIKLDSPGPVFFRQPRLGRDRRPFPCFKLRTMIDGSSDDPHRRYIARLMNDPTATPRDGLYKLADDARVTRVGALLRATSLDELPQLLNILRGEMSLVGPRPVVAYEVEHYDPQDHQRFTVLPGLTGLWQISGRSRRSYREMLDLDTDYARRWSPWLDLKILWRTLAAVLSSPGR